MFAVGGGRSQPQVGRTRPQVMSKYCDDTSDWDTILPTDEHSELVSF